MSELLSYVNLDEYFIFNKTTIQCFVYLEISNLPKYTYQYTGRKFFDICAYAKEISNELKKSGVKDYDFLAVDYFMWDEILTLIEKKVEEQLLDTSFESNNGVDFKSLHDKIKDELVKIGEILGFENHSEVKITTGAVVDAMWEAKIGNIGKAIYVFEVQSKRIY